MEFFIFDSFMSDITSAFTDNVTELRLSFIFLKNMYIKTYESML